MEQSPKYTPPPEGNKIITSSCEKEPEIKKHDNSIFRQIQEPMTRRNFLKIATKAAIGLTTGYVVNKEIDGMLAEYQKEKISKAIKESKDLQTSTDLLEKIVEYPEMIESSEKQTINEFAKDLAIKDFDNLIFGEPHSLDPTAEKAAYLLEELIQNGKKVSAICLEGLSYTSPKHIELTKRFNKGEMLPEEFSRNIGHMELDPLVKLAKKHSIEIIGLEEQIQPDPRNWFGKNGRFKKMSERVAQVTKEKIKDGIVATYVGLDHVTIDSWENRIFFNHLAGKKDYFPPREETLENNYTIKEYLEKINLKPVAIQIEYWINLASEADRVFANEIDRLSPKDRKIFYEKVKNKWQSFILKEKEDFLVPYPYAKENTYSMISPTLVPVKPPKLSEKMGDN